MNQFDESSSVTSKWWSLSLRAVSVSRQSNDQPQFGISLFRPLSLRMKSTKLQKLKLSSDLTSAGNRRQSTAGADQSVADFPVHPARQKFRARRSLSVTQTSVRVDPSGEFESLRVEQDNGRSIGLIRCLVVGHHELALDI